MNDDLIEFALNRYNTYWEIYSFLKSNIESRIVFNITMDKARNLFLKKGE